MCSGLVIYTTDDRIMVRIMRATMDDKMEEARDQRGDRCYSVLFDTKQVVLLEPPNTHLCMACGVSSDLICFIRFHDKRG